MDRGGVALEARLLELEAGVFVADDFALPLDVLPDLDARREEALGTDAPALEAAAFDVVVFGVDAFGVVDFEVDPLDVVDFEVDPLDVVDFDVDPLDVVDFDVDGFGFAADFLPDDLERAPFDFVLAAPDFRDAPDFLDALGLRADFLAGLMGAGR